MVIYIYKSPFLCINFEQSLDRSKVFLEEAHKTLNNAFLLTGAITIAKARHSWHNAVYVGACGLKYTVAE